MAVDFRALLAKPVDDIKRPPALPAGTYYGSVTKHEVKESRFADKDTNEKHAVVQLTFGGVRAGEDIDQTLLDGIDLNKRPLSAELPLSGGYEWTTKDLCDKLGVDTAGRGFGELIPELLGKEVMFTVTQRADKNDVSVMYNDVRSVRAVPVTA